MRSSVALLALAAAFAALAAAAPAITTTTSVSLVAKPLFDRAAAAESSAGLGAPGSPRRVRLVASDVDGTLLDSNHKFTPRTLMALKTLPADCTFVIATGKSRGAVVRLLEAVFGTDRAWPPSINLNGLITYGSNGQVLREYRMQPHVAARIVAYAERKRFDFVVHSGTDIFSSRRQEEFDAYLRLRDEPAVQIAERLVERLTSGEIPCHKILFFAEPAELVRLRAARPNDSEIANVFVPQDSPLAGEHVYLLSAVPEVLEICPSGVSKATALSGLSEMLGIAGDEVIALGDGENDVEMLKWAGTGVVMANGMPKAIEAADYMTLSNDNDGVAAVVETIACEQWNVLTIASGRISCRSSAAETGASVAFTAKTWDGVSISAHLDRKPDASDAENGRKKPLAVVCHGLLNTHRADTVRELCSRLPYSCVTFDFRGMGHSTGETSLGNYVSEADDIDAVVAEVRRRWHDEFELVAVVGHSKGASAAQFWAQKVMERWTDKFLANDANPEFDWWRAGTLNVVSLAGPFNHGGSMKFTAEQVAALSRVPQAGEEEPFVVLKEYGGGKDSNLEASNVDSDVDPAGAFPVRQQRVRLSDIRQRLNTSLEPVAEAARKFFREGRTPPFRVRILTVHGGEDDVVPVIDAYLAHDLLKPPLHQLFVVPNADHCFTRAEDMDVVAAHIISWVDAEPTA